jgi:predicted phosphodiesterase
MKISICSDLHLEFGDLDIKNTDQAEVLVLAGDICVARDLLKFNDTELPGFANFRSQRYHEFFQRVCQEWKHVIYVMGNHEHYHGDFATTVAHIRECLGYNVNLHVLDKECVFINDIRFVCGTLWTDMNKEDELTLYSIGGVMNDFRLIKDSREPVHFRDEEGTFRTRLGSFSPQASVEDHKAMIELIQDECALDWDKIVVVGHHAPSKLSTHPRYKSETIVNGAYSSNLDEFMLDNPKIKAWIHGHTHESFDYMIGSCRVVCNPRGYIGHESRADSYVPQTIEIS